MAANCQKVSDREYMQKYLNVYLSLTEFRKKTHNLKTDLKYSFNRLQTIS